MTGIAGNLGDRRVLEQAQRMRFEQLVLPHMDAAFSLARWLMRDEAEAEEAVQEAYLRAFRFFAAFRGGDARPWLLGIVRNTCCTLHGSTARALSEFDEDACREDTVAAGAVVRLPVDPEAAAIEHAERELVHRCLRALPAEYREALVLRELHDCSYKEIAQIANIPIGTVMSRLARGRRLLGRTLAGALPQRGTGT